MIPDWTLLPIAFFIASIATSVGVGGAIFFSPLLLIVFGLPIELVFTLSLFIEVFGFSSGLIGYLKDKLVDFKFALSLLKYAIPGVVIGTFVFEYVNESFARTAFSLLLLAIGLLMIIELKKSRIVKKECELRCVNWKKGKICYDLPNSRRGINSIILMGGVFVGMFSSGIGEFDEYIFLKKLKMHAALAAGTSLFVVAIVAIIGSILKISILAENPELLSQALPLAFYAIPGVIVGGQMGSRISKRIANPYVMKKVVGVIILLLSLLMLLFNA